MSGSLVAQEAAVERKTGVTRQLATDVNSYRIGIVAEKLAMSAQNGDPQKFFHLCLSLARGIDYGVANNESPAQASKLTPVLKQVCSRKREFYLQSAIMVLMISVKNACKLGWFSAKDTEDLLTLADEVGNYFCTRRDSSNETSDLMPMLSSVMSRYYPMYKLGHIITSFEVKPGYGTYLMDFHITKDLLITKDERIRLLVAMKDNVETSSCIISPQQVNILLNGRPVDKRTNVNMDPGPQIPTLVNQLLKYGSNLLQAVGQFSGNYIIVVAAMSTLQTSDLPAPQDYVQPDTILSGPDSEISEGPSRISLNCPISYRRIKIPAKGHLCKHYQCFDLSNFVEINAKRPSWRCPHCNQSAGFTDLRVDRMMVKVLQEAGENVSEVTIHADGSWNVASSCGKDDSHEKTTNKQGEHEADESPGKSDGQCNVFDLTGDDCEMDTSDGHMLVDEKPVLHNLQSQSNYLNSASPSNPRSANESFQFPFSQAANGLNGAANYNIRSEALTDGGISGGLLGNPGITPVLTDAVSPSLNQQPNNFQGTNYPTSSIGLPQLSPSDNLQLQEALYRSIPRNVTRVSSAIQALPVQMPTPSSQQNVRPLMTLPAASGSSVPFQMPRPSTQQVGSTFGASAERQRHLPQAHINAFNGSSMPTPSMQHRATSQGVGMSGTNYNSRISQTSSQSHLMQSHQTLSQPPHMMRLPQILSQPPHLMRSSQLPRSHPQPQVAAMGVGSNNNSPSSIQRVNLTSSQPSQVRQTPTLLHSQTHLSRTSSSLPLNSGVAPTAVTRTENLIDLQQAEWRPSGRMRGALTGPAYSAALNHFMSPGTTSAAQTPSPRPSENPMQAANQMIARATQMHHLPTSASGTNNQTLGMRGDGSRG
ncbi:hypothetical protein RND81_08G111100 [Saponaria officinalis]|uniref:SP-RING-type domain-containing protein n=1 Tax=Saponaria officinalis TaxID=3572 RepID=A0AAW1J6E3_SAPOF